MGGGDGWMGGCREWGREVMYGKDGCYSDGYDEVGGGCFACERL